MLDIIRPNQTGGGGGGVGAAAIRKAAMPVKGYAAIVYVFEAIRRLFLV